MELKVPITIDDYVEVVKKCPQSVIDINVHLPNGDLKFKEILDRVYRS